MNHRFSSHRSASVLAAASVVLLASTLAQHLVAQNLLNGDFEQSTVSNPAIDWGWSWSAQGQIQKTLLTKAQSPADVFCGQKSLALTVTQVGYHEFGKHWNGNHRGQVLQGVVRLKLSSASLASMVKLVAYDVNPGSQVVPSATTDWQELQVSALMTSPTANQARIGLEINGMPTSEHIVLDYAVFGGSDPRLNAGKFPDHEVASGGLSLLLNGATGDLRHLRWRDTATGVLGDNLLHGSVTTPLWEIRGYHVSGSAKNAFPTMSTGASTPPTAITQSAGTLRVVRDTSPDPLSVQVDIVAGAAGEIVLTPTIAYRDPSTRVREIDIAPLRLPRQLGTSQGDDLFFAPSGDGGIASPFRFENSPPGLSTMAEKRGYPGGASMQLLAYFDSTQGVTLSSRDTMAESKELSFEYVRASSSAPRLLIRHLTPEEPGAPIASVPIVLERCSGSWMDAAARYRAWALQQTWAQRDPQLPTWVAERPMSFDADMQPQQIGLPLVPLQPASTWRTVLDDWRTLIGGAPGFPLMPLFRHFEQHGVYTTGPNMLPLSVRSSVWNPTNNTYDELYSAAQIAAAWREAVAGGHLPMTMVTGLKWARQRAQTPATLCAGTWDVAWWVPRFDASHNGWNGSGSHAPGVQVCTTSESLTSTNQTVVITQPSSDAAWDTEHGRMCPAHADTVNDYVTLARELARSGTVVYQLDQMNGGYTPACYNTNHGHPRGNGRWRWEEVRDLLIACRDEGRALNAQFGLSMEDPGELLIPYMAVMGTRPGNIHGWPATTQQFAPYQKVVPAFQFVYSSVMASCTWDVGVYSDNPNVNNGGFPGERRYDAIRVARMAGAGSWIHAQIHPWTFLLGVPVACGSVPPTLPLPTPQKTDPNMAQLLKNCAKIGREQARDYLNNGLMARPDGHVIPTLRVHDYPAGGITHDAVVLSAWRLPEKRFGILLVNADYGESGQGAVTTVWSLPLTLDGELVPAATPVTITTSNGTLPTAAYGNIVTNFDVPANGVAFLELQL